MTREDREAAIQRLKASAEALASAVHGLSPEQWRFKPDPETWSIGQCVEHLCLTEQQVLASLKERVATEPPRVEPQSEVAGKDELILKAVPSRRRKAPAPESFHPCAEPRPLTDALAHFQTLRRESVEFTSTTQVNLREYFFEHFALKQLDAYQWMLPMAAHAERHAAQMNEVKTHPDYPPFATSSGLP